MLAFSPRKAWYLGKACPQCKTEFPGGEIFCPNDGARLVNASQVELDIPAAHVDPLVGQVVEGRYRIIRQIGEGGMGVVYEAIHIAIEKRVALKVLRDDFSAKADVVERFRQEAKAASRIGHEHIVDISDFGETPQGNGFFVMEMLVGEDLSGLLAKEKALPARRAAKIVIQCCKALGAAHAKGIVHRDMKPENIFMVRRDDEVEDFAKIVDFGIAKMNDIETPGAPGRKLTKTGMIFGTPEYMSPEQAAGKQLDHRVDIYAMGVILYELLTGRVPFVGDTFMGVLTQHMFEQPPPLKSLNPDVLVPSNIEDIIFKALAKDPNQRFQTMDEMSRALAHALDITSTNTQAPTQNATGGADTTLRGVADPVSAVARGPRVFEPTAATQFDMSYAPPQPATTQKKSNTGLLVGGGVALALVGVIAFVMASKSSKPAEVAPPVVVAHEEPVHQEAVPPPVPAPTPTPEVPPSDAVKVRVVTDPVGAEIEVQGRGLVCPGSPCEFTTKANETITVIARKGRATASRQITPSANFDFELHLAAPHVAAPGPSPRPAAEHGNGGGDHNDIYAPCRQACEMGLKGGPLCPDCDSPLLRR